MVKARYRDIFLTTLRIGIIGFGGGPATIPLFHKQVIDKEKWLSTEEFSDILAVTNALPGPVQTKLAGYIGYRLRGIVGMLLGLVGIITPSLILMGLFLNQIYQNKDKPWMNGITQSIFPVITVMMIFLTWDFFKKSTKSINLLYHLILLTTAFIFLVIFNLHPAFLIILTLLFSFVPKISELKRMIFILFSALLIIIINILKIDQIVFEFIKDIINLPKINTNIKNLKIFIAFFIPGIIGYGGGPASIPLVEYEVIQHFALIGAETFDLAYAVQAVLPGVTATKLAGYIGYEAGGIIGCLIGIIGYVAPSLILMISLLHLIQKYKSSPVVKRLTQYVRPTITVLLGMLAYRFFMSAYNGVGIVQSIIIMLVSSILLQKLKVHPFFVICGVSIYGAFFIR